MSISKHEKFNDGGPANRTPITKQAREDFLQAGIKLYSYAGTGTMHHKFFIFERNAANNGQCLLWTDTYNATDKAEASNCEDVILFDEPAVIEAFNGEFSNMEGYALRIPSLPTATAKRIIPDDPRDPSEEPIAKKIFLVP